MRKFTFSFKMLLVAFLLLGGANSAWADEWSVDFGAIISAEGLKDKTEVSASTESTVTIGGTTMGTVTLGSTAVNSNFVMQTGEKWLARTGGYIHNQSSGNKSFAIRNCLAGQIIILRVGNATVNSATNATLLSGENGVNIYKVIADGDVKISHARYLYIYGVKVLNSYTITDESFPFTSSFGTNSNPFVGANYNVSGTDVSNLIQVTNTGAVALFDTSESPSGKYAVKEGEKLTISFTAYNGYYSSGTTGVSIKNSDGVVLAGYTYSLSNSAVTVTVGGEVVSTGELTGRSYYSGTSGANGLSNGSNRGYVATAGMNPVVTLTLMHDGTLTFSIIGGSANYTYTTPTPLEAKMDVASFAIYCTADNSDRTFCMGNLSVNAEPLVVATPTFTIGSYNYEEGGYAVTPSCATEGATLTYTIGEGAATACTSGVPFYAKGGKLNITASKAGWTSSSLAENDRWTLNSAPSSTSPETLIPFQASNDNGDKNIEHVYKSVTITGGNSSAIAGIVSGKASELKLRTNQNDNTVTLNVNPGYTVTKVSIAAKSNNEGATIGLTSTTVDGGDNIMAGTTTFPNSKAASAVEYVSGTISANNNIVFTFDNSAIDGTTGKKNKQIQATIKVWYKSPAENAYNKLKDAAEALRDVPNDNSAANSTLSSVITTQNAAVEAATNDAQIITAKTALQNAVMTYIAAANPTTGNQFDLTFLLTNPNLEGIVDWGDAAAQGWFTDIPRTGLGTYNNFAARTNQSKNCVERYTSDVYTTANTFGLYQKVTLPAGNYSFGAYALADNASNIVMAAGNAEGDAVTAGTLTAYTVDFTQASNSEIKMGLKISAEGTNAAHWMAIADLKLYKEAPTSVTATISEYGWATFSSDYALDFSKATEGLEAYMITGHEGNVVTKSKVEGTVPAGTGLLLKGDAGDYTIPVVASSETNVSANKLVAGTGAEVSEGGDNTRYVLGVNDNGTDSDESDDFAEFQKIGGTAATVAKGKAYLEFVGVSLVKVFNIVDGAATGVEAPVAAEAAVEDGIYYNLNGQQVTKDYKGIVIVNGKKFYNK